MSFRFTFLLSSYLLIFLGMFGLFLTEEISLPYLLLAGAGFVFGALREVRGSKALLPALGQNILLVAVFLHTLVAIFLLRELPLLALAQFLLALQAVKLLGPKKGRDWSLLYLLSFFSVVAASALSVEVFFAGIFVAYLFVAPWVLVLSQLKEGTETAGKDPDKETRLLGWPLFRLVGSINIILFLLTLALFITFPRFGVGLLGDLWASGGAVVGFSDRLTLGEVSKIQKNGAVAMRVSLDQPRPQGEKELYWRGVALDHFDGRKWEKSTNEGVPVRRIGEGYRLGEAPERRAPLIRQKIILEPTGSPVLFALDKPVMIFGRLGYLFRDSLGNVLALQPFPFQISYEVLSYTEPGWKDKPPDSNFLQLPTLHPRIVTLSRQLTEGLGDEGRKARALERFFRENYQYALEDLPVGGNDPLADFLFEVRRGNCEYFASALAIMLRTLGIPARVVNGYLGGEWNPYGEYYLIRQSNAHSWVEAYLPGQGWVTLDPTPSAPRGRALALFSSLTNFADFLRLNWYRYVINFGLADQYQLFKALRQPHQWLGVTSRGFSLRDLTARFSTSGKGWLELGIAMAVLALGWIGLKNLRGRKNAPARNALHAATKRYHRLLALCAKRGLKKRPAETPDEFSQRVGTQGNGLVEEFTSLYQEARFSGPHDFSGRLKKMDDILADLRKNRPQLNFPA
jgi:transglutaminase-like putative cysteine protease